ncbi:MAG: hypothetical protein COS11_05950 [bacterium (Candidatus Ratteibacteria) CG01_land_8_20_14_3_00_40_19]|uniref:Uncharacterized protein n=1 Tax=bacterium (Candidatus Ratteibacteria) CG01_land_8_20_14_3_00_40_19 TaxID=2014290 RepID=A0A2M7E7J3_9BACT|nr:MAG: hypothetical protein COS11_05950 [bacterium (Candidatus Ratteibacteria) CG01_land_8_20_14_3_00_40_19]
MHLKKDPTFSVGYIARLLRRLTSRNDILSLSAKVLTKINNGPGSPLLSGITVAGQREESHLHFLCLFGYLNLTTKPPRLKEHQEKLK